MEASHGIVRHRRLRQARLSGVQVGADAVAFALHVVGGWTAVPLRCATRGSVQAAEDRAQAEEPAAPVPVAHGTHRGYRGGCRCRACATAQTHYVQALRRRPEQLDATPAREYLQQLAAHGIGTKQAALLSGVPRSTLWRIRHGRTTRLAPTRLAAILGIRSVPALGALTKAWPTRRLLRWFRLEGFSDAEVARRLGYRSLQLRFASAYCTVRNAARVRALHRKVAQL
jgi:hypothetical protein